MIYLNQLVRYHTLMSPMGISLHFSQGLEKKPRLGRKYCITFILSHVISSWGETACTILGMCYAAMHATCGLIG